MEMSFLKKNDGNTKRLRNAFFFIFFYLVFCYYIYSNLDTDELQHNSKGLIGIIVFMSIFCLNINYNKIRLIRISYSTASFVLFVLYFTTLCIINMGGDELWPVLLGSESGIFYYYGFGIVFSLVASRFFQWSRAEDHGSKVLLTSIFISVMGTIMLLNVVQSALGRSRDDIYLVSYGDELYQWPADILSIWLIVVSVVCGSALIAYKKLEKLGLVLYLFNGALFTAQCVLAIYYLQIIGSNKGMLVVLSCLIIIMSLMITVIFPGLGAIKMQIKAKKQNSVIIGNVMGVLFPAFCMIVLGLYVLLMLLIYLDFPFDKFRISGYGSYEISSIDSRIDLINNNFTSQFSVSPILGNPKAEILAGYSSGEYVHSLFFYLLTHAGVVGTIIFVSAVFFRVSEFRTSKFSESSPVVELKNSNYLINSLLICLFISIVLISCIATSLLWAPLWFSIGFLSPSVCKQTV